MMSVIRIRLFAVFSLLSLAIAAQAQSPAEGKKLYLSYCASCHGESAKGDGVAARSLPVKPADHTDGAVMNRLPDTFLVDVITKGGSAVNRSAFMPGWGNSLDAKQVLDIVAFLRSIANPPYQEGKAGAK